jgi:hypothetical protein
MSQTSGIGALKTRVEDERSADHNRPGAVLQRVQFGAPAGNHVREFVHILGLISRRAKSVANRIRRVGGPLGR